MEKNIGVGKNCLKNINNSKNIYHKGEKNNKMNKTNNKTEEIVRKFNELFELCEEYNIVVTIEGDTMSGDRVSEAFQDKDKILIW